MRGWRGSKHLPNTQISTLQIVGCRLQGEEDLHSTTSIGHLPVDDPQNGHQLPFFHPEQPNADNHPCDWQSP